MTGHLRRIRGEWAEDLTDVEAVASELRGADICESTWRGSAQKVSIKVR